MSMTSEHKATSSNRQAWTDERRVQSDESEQTSEKAQAQTKLIFCENEASSIKNRLMHLCSLKKVTIPMLNTINLQ